MEKIEKTIKKRLSESLPGFEAHRHMAPVSRLDSIRYCPPDARQSSVLVLLVPDHSKRIFSIPLMVRTHDGFVHSGQISFPGGKFEDSDRTYMNTAFREAEEECGIDSSQCRIAGKLSNIFIPPSNFYVHPFVAFYDGKIDYTIVNEEVSQLISVTLNELESLKTSVAMSIQGQLTDVPCFIKDHHIIWGATAMILNELLCICRDLLP